MSTIKQKRALQKMVENGGNVSQAMIQAGYAPATAKTPKKLTKSDGFKIEAGKVLQDLKMIRIGVVEELKGRDLSKESPMTLVRINDILTKNIELLAERPTERGEMVISWVN